MPRSRPRQRRDDWVEPTPLASWKPPGDRYIGMLLDDADRKDRIARILESTAESPALTKPDE